MSRLFTVLLDMDSTVYDLWTPTFDYINNKYGYSLDPTMLESWNWCTNNGIDPTEYWDKEGCFLNLQPFNGAVKAIEQAHNRGIKQVFFTKIVAKYAAWEKLQAVDRDFPFIGHKSVLMTGGDKSLAKGDILIDDGPGFLAEFKEATGNPVVLANLQGSPYSNFPQADATMTSWSQYNSIISSFGAE